jgi:alpha-beta hydrolase superfamily lysophospholipase
MILLVGCETPEFTDPEEIECGADEAVVTFGTRDGVDLVADYRPADEPNKGAVVLFHMAPPDNDRSGWPEVLRRGLADIGISVLNVDRRGAGDSGGNAPDATRGIMARLDMEAATDFLTAGRRCAVDSTQVVLVGAGNGTTSVMDYTVAHEPELLHPSGLVWMSPGTYTESNNRVLDNREILEPLPILWLYPTDEPYSDQWIAGAGDDWEFHADGEAPGTRMFDGAELQDSTVERLIVFVQRYAD